MKTIYFHNKWHNTIQIFTNTSHRYYKPSGAYSNCPVFLKQMCFVWVKTSLFVSNYLVIMTFDLFVKKMFVPTVGYLIGIRPNYFHVLHRIKGRLELTLYIKIHSSWFFYNQNIRESRVCFWSGCNRIEPWEIISFPSYDNSTADDVEHILSKHRKSL